MVISGLRQWLIYLTTYDIQNHPFYKNEITTIFFNQLRLIKVLKVLKENKTLGTNIIYSLMISPYPVK